MRKPWSWLLDAFREGVRRAPHRPPPQASARLAVEALEARVVLDTDIWIATSAGFWNVPSNWSTGHEPYAGDNVVFELGSGSSSGGGDTGGPGGITPGGGSSGGGSGGSSSPGVPGDAGCVLDEVTPLLGSVLFAANWDHELDIGADNALNAASVVLSARTGGGPTYNVAINSSSASVNCGDLVFDGGGLGTLGPVNVSNSVTVATASSDTPTLGTQLNLGNGSTSATMTFSTLPNPLVVRDNANITVNMGSLLDFSGAAPAGSGSAVTVISAGDTNYHQITVNGGAAQDASDIEQDVAMNMVVENGGTFTVAPNTMQGDQAGAFCLTAAGADGYALSVVGGSADLSKDATFAGGCHIDGGSVNQASNCTLTFAGPLTIDAGTYGQDSDSTVITKGATIGSAGGAAAKLILKSVLQSDGDVTLNTNGQVLTNESTTSTISLGSGAFLVKGGAILVTFPNGARGDLTVNGNMTVSGGDIWINCNSSAGDSKSGELTVTATFTLAANNTATLHVSDLAATPTSQQFTIIQVCTDGGGDFSSYAFSAGLTGGWFDSVTQFIVTTR
jgi:hypothetical protein